MSFTQDFRTQRRNYSDGETRIGEKDRLWYDSGTNSIRIGDGVTPGGVIVGGSGGGSDYVLPTASALVKGGVKIGSNITITDGVISVAAPFSGSYDDLTNKPTIPSLTGYATESFVTSRGYLTSIGTGTITNAMLEGNIANAKLFNSTVTIGSTVVALGTTAVNLAGLNSVTATNFVGNATTVTNGVYTNSIGAVTDIMLAGSIANNKLTNSSITVNGTSISLGSSATITAAAGTLTGTTLNSSVVSSSLTSVGTLTNLSVTNTITGSVSGNAGTVTNGVYTTDTGTVTNTMLAGSIANNKLANSSVTVNGTSISLGSSATVTAAAGTLTGTILNSTVVTSSLTSVGTLTSLAVTNSSSSPVTVTYTPATTTGVGIISTGKDTQGGTGYYDFFRAINTTSGVTSGSKTFRLTSTGSIEIINSAYNANLFSLTDTGGLSVPGPISISGKKAVNGPAFRAYVSVGQQITSGSQQKVTFGTENFDTDSCFATSTFTPNIEGYYQFNATVRISGGASTGEYMLVLYKNGNEYARGHNGSGTEIGASFYSLQVSDIAYANGSTDNFDIRIQQTSGSDKTTTAGSAISYFSGCMIRGA
jgi:hypothetical protein